MFCLHVFFKYSFVTQALLLFAKLGKVSLKMLLYMRLVCGYLPALIWVGLG